MKIRTFIYFLLLAGIFTSCKRKKTEIEPEGKLATYAAHCYNGITDSDETNPDCGGSCGSCNVAVPTCTQSTNYLTLSNSNYSITNITFGNLNSLSTYDFKGDYAGGTLTVRIAGGSPDITQEYAITTSPTPNPYEAYVNINSSTFGSMASGTGKVYINQIGGKYYALVCGATFYSFVTTQSYNGIINIQNP